MEQTKRTSFDLENISFHDITPYSEIYGDHPHYLLSTANGWKRNPARACPFTGKSPLVLRERRKQVRRLLKPTRARETRKRLITLANAQLIELQAGARYANLCEPASQGGGELRPGQPSTTLDMSMDTSDSTANLDKNEYTMDVDTNDVSMYAVSDATPFSRI